MGLGNQTTRFPTLWCQAFEDLDYILHNSRHNMLWLIKYSKSSEVLDYNICWWRGSPEGDWDGYSQLQIIMIICYLSFVCHYLLFLIIFIHHHQKLTLRRLRWFLTASERRESTSTSTENDPMYWNKIHLWIIMTRCVHSDSEFSKSKSEHSEPWSKCFWMAISLVHVLICHDVIDLKCIQ